MQGIDADGADVWKRFLKASYVMRSEHHHDPVYKRYHDAWADQFVYVFNGMKVDANAGMAADHFKARLAGAPAFEEVYSVIEALRPHYRLALLSNADDDFLEEALANNGLEFDTVVTSEQAGAIKPNPAIFHYMCDRMEMAPPDVLYVGDNPIPDVLGPSRAGMPSAWVNRFGMRKPRKIPQPTIRVKSLTELAKKLVPGVTDGERSRELFEMAQGLMPGGVSSPVRAFKAVGGNPPVIAYAEGPSDLRRRWPAVRRLRVRVRADDPRAREPGGRERDRRRRRTAARRTARRASSRSCWRG